MYYFIKKHFKYIMFSVLTAIAIISLNTVICSADTEIKVFLEDKMLNTSAIEQNGSAYLPVRAFFESLGFSVEWNDNQNSVTANSENVSVNMTLGQNQLILNGKVVTTDNAIIELNGLTYAPLRAIAQALGYTVEWYDSAQTAVIKSDKCLYNFYFNTPSLMPTFESVVLNAPIAQSNWVAEDVGIYYMYKGSSEQDALNYADILEQKFGFTYDSMQLSETYGKLYVYVNDKTTAIVEVLNDAVRIYPSVSSRYAYEPLKHDETSQILQNDVKNNTPSQNGQTPNTAPPSDTVYYDGTSIPDYSYITGRALFKQSTTDKGYPVNIYYSSIFDVMEYMTELNLAYGFDNYTMNTSPFDMAVTYTIQKQNEYVTAVYSMMSDCVYISYGTK